MDPSLDLPTLRFQLDALIRDQAEFSSALAAKQQQIEQLTREVSHYHGALEYNRVLREKLTAALSVKSP